MYVTIHTENTDQIGREKHHERKCFVFLVNLNNFPNKNETQFRLSALCPQIKLIFLQQEKEKQRENSQQLANLPHLVLFCLFTLINKIKKKLHHHNNRELINWVTI